MRKGNSKIRVRECIDREWEKVNKNFRTWGNNLLIIIIIKCLLSTVLQAFINLKKYPSKKQTLPQSKQTESEFCWYIFSQKYERFKELFFELENKKTRTSGAVTLVLIVVVDAEAALCGDAAHGVVHALWRQQARGVHLLLLQALAAFRVVVP